jgi:hypothetical protein
MLRLLVLLSVAFQDVKEPRKTPLGVQRVTPPLSESLSKIKPKKDSAPAETANQAVQRAVNAHGGNQKIDAIQDATLDGSITLYDEKGTASTFPLKLLRKGEAQVQRIITRPGDEIRQGVSESHAWNSVGGHSTPASGDVLDFLETQTVRSLKQLFDYQQRGHRLRDDGLKGSDRLLTVEDETGRSTHYTIDGLTSRVTKVEFETSRSRNMFSGQLISVKQTFALSDYRLVDGVWTPFRIERFTGGAKVEEMRFTAVKHNSSLKNEVFHQ